MSFSAQVPRSENRPPLAGVLPWLLGTLLLTLVACRREQAAPQARPLSVPPEQAHDAPDEDQQQDKAAVAEAGPATEPNSPQIDEVDDGALSEIAAAPEEQSPEVEQQERGVRLLLLSSVGPLLIQLDINLEGQPIDAAVQQLTTALLAGNSIDAEPPRWESWVADARFPRFALGVPANFDHRRMGEQQRLWDRDGDDQVDAEEVVALLAGQGRALGTFALNAGAAQQQVWDSPLRRWLDVDEDGRLVPEEMEQAEHRLRARDADADDVLHATDLTMRVEGSEPGEMQRLGSGVVRAALLLHPQRYWRRHLLALQRYYSTTDGLQAGSFPHMPSLFSDLDADQDSNWNADELAALLDRQPDLRLQLHYDSSGAAPLEMKIVDAPTGQVSSWQRLVAEQTKVVLEWNGMRLECQTADNLPQGTVQDVAAQWMESWDQDQNDYLDPQEFQQRAGSLAQSFRLVDLDSDEQLDLEELAAMVRLERQQRGVVVRAEVGVAPDPLFTALDVNYDGRLTTRELIGATGRLQRLDTNDDQVVTLAEVPTSLSLRIVRGGPSLPRIPTEEVVTTPAYDAAAWFRAMDANADADLSPREFLGTPAQFAELDSDGDGLVGVSEAKQWEKAAEIP